MPDSVTPGLAALKVEFDGTRRRWGDPLLPGGWVHARLDQPSEPHLYGNKQGGFQVCCPACQNPLARELSEALRHWRAGGERTLACPQCTGTSPLEDLSYRPAAALGHFAIELRDVHSLTLTADGRQRFEALLSGRFHIIGSRG